MEAFFLIKPLLKMEQMNKQIDIYKSLINISNREKIKITD